MSTNEKREWIQELRVPIYYWRLRGSKCERIEVGTEKNVPDMILKTIPWVLVLPLLPPSDLNSLIP